MVGEVYLLDPERLSAYVRTGRELDLAHNFHFLTLPWSAPAFRDAIEEYQGLVSPRGWPTWCLNNHDHSRVASRYPGEAAARLAAMMLLTLRGTPFLFQGEELGLEDGVVSGDRIVDVSGRDPERCPIPWEPSSPRTPGGGFTTGRPWLPLPPDADRHNVATEAAQPKSILSLYRRLLQVRRSAPALSAGESTMVPAADPNVLAYRRTAGAMEFLIVLNFGEQRTFVSAHEIGHAFNGVIEVSTCLDRVGERVTSKVVDVAPLHGLVIRER
jgi:alpha-glucosidase